MARQWLGKEVNEALFPELAERISALSARGIRPCLAVYQAGDAGESASYLKGLTKRFAALGAEVLARGPYGAHEEEAMLRDMERDAENPAISGMMPLFPVPSGWNAERIRRAIAPEKDVDGMRLDSLGRLLANEEGFVNCAVDSILVFLKHFGVRVWGKRVALFGAGALIGRPLGLLLLREGATVTWINTKTPNPAEISRECDVLFGCAGSPGVIGPECVRPGHVVIDAGTSYVNGALLGDLDPEAAGLAEAYTPTPGGVAAVTTTVLCEHTVRAAERASLERDHAEKHA